jgi:hypothetical protein
MLDGINVIHSLNNTWSSTVIPTGYLVDWAGDNTGNGFESVLII